MEDLLAWDRTYETVRPHQALGCKTPDQFYRHWLNNNKGKEALSDFSWLRSAPSPLIW